VEEVIDVRGLKYGDGSCGDPSFLTIDSALKRTQPIFVLEYTQDMNPE
jgi:hypothetical protein